jgi:hypothetical protein
MSAPATILDALADKDLFAPLFPGATWSAWHAFLAGLFGLPLADDALALYQHHTGRVAAPVRPFREAAIVCGRRGGKSRVLGLIAAYLGAFVDYRSYLAPGEQPVIAIIAADRKQARVLLRYVIGTLRAVPMLSSLIEGDPLAESVTLTNGLVIEIHTSTIASPRGRTFVAVLADEIAFWQSADGAANPDGEVIAAVRPGLASIPNSILLMASSPYAKRGVLWQAFRQHFGKDDARMLVWRGTTAEMNPPLDPEIIREAYEVDPDNAASEFGAEFRSDIAAFIDRAVVESLIVPGRFELPPVAGISYSAFVDSSGGSSDSMTLAVAHAGHDGRAVLDCLREVRAPFQPEGVVADFAAVLRSYRISSVKGDRYAGEWPREQFRKHGIEYITSDKAKSDIYKELLPILNGGKAELLDNTRFVAQLCSLERRTARGGRDSIDHPQGSGWRDDLANSGAGALVEVAAAAAPALWRFGDLVGDGEALPVPSICERLFATVAVDEFGTASCLFWASTPRFGVMIGRVKVSDAQLVLVDYEAAPFGAGFLSGLADRMASIEAICRPRMGRGVLFVDPGLAVQSRDAGLTAFSFVPLEEPGALALFAAGAIRSGVVKISTLAAERSYSLPLPLAGFRADATDAPSTAVVAGIVAGLEGGRALGEATQ